MVLPLPTGASAVDNAHIPCCTDTPSDAASSTVDNRYDSTLIYCSETRHALFHVLRAELPDLPVAQNPQVRSASTAGALLAADVRHSVVGVPSAQLRRITICYNLARPFGAAAVGAHWSDNDVYVCTSLAARTSTIPSWASPRYELRFVSTCALRTIAWLQDGATVGALLAADVHDTVLGVCVHYRISPCWYLPHHLSYLVRPWHVHCMLRMFTISVPFNCLEQDPIVFEPAIP